jgi:hypothetical protein
LPIFKLVAFISFFAVECFRLFIYSIKCIVVPGEHNI